MLRPLQDIAGRPALDDAALMHDHDPVGDLGDDAKIMGDQQHAHPALTLEPGDQLEDLALRGDVERRGRLVGDQQMRFQRHRHRDHHALALSA